MTKSEAKAIVNKLLIDLVDNGSVKVQLGTKESKALIVLTKS